MKKKAFYGVLLIFLTLMGACTPEKKVTLFLVGDSTMAPKKERKRPETGWGEMLENYIDTSKVTIENHARNGRSSRTFMEEGRWDSIMTKLSVGDVVFVQFGHNDEVQTKKSSTTPDIFQENLKKYITDTRSKNALPVLLTSVTRRSYGVDSIYYDSHEAYNKLMREVASEQNVILIDLNVSSSKLIKESGFSESVKFYLQADSAILPNYPKGVRDNTHFNSYGANIMAELAVKEIRAKNVKSLVNLLK